MEKKIYVLEKKVELLIKLTAAQSDLINIHSREILINYEK